MCLCSWHSACVEVGCQLAGVGYFSPSTMAVLGIKLRPSDLAASAFTGWTILPALWEVYRRPCKRLWPLICLSQDWRPCQRLPKIFLVLCLCHLRGVSKTPSRLSLGLRRLQSIMHILEIFFFTLPSSSPSLATRVLVTVFSSGYLKSFQGKQFP